ncbi:MAG: EAL domain-containing protein [Gammaproteobacteria bacterium]
MNNGDQSFEDTATLQARAARRGARATVLAALSHVAEPLVLLPLGALLILAFIWTTTIHLIRVESDNARSAALASTRELLGTYEAQVLRALREIDQTLRFVKYAAETKGDRLALAELQQRSLLPPNLLFVVSLVDANGGVVASTGDAHPKSVRDQAYFTALRDLSAAAGPELWIGRPHRDAQSGAWTLHFGRRLTAPDGSFAGIVTVGIDAAYFSSGYEASKLGLEGVLGVLGKDGIFRVRRTGTSVYAGDAVAYGAVVSPSTGDEDPMVSLVVSPWDGVRRFTGARELYDYPVAVIVGLSAKEQLAAAADYRRLYLQRAAIGSSLVIALTGILYRLIWQLLQSRRREFAANIANNARVEYLAYHDGLSGLPNRSLFSKLLARGIKLAHRHQRRLAVLFLDLDRFKQINDTLGHEAGDQLLQEVARRLQSSLRDSDTVARLGGDEFVVLLPELESLDYAAVVAQKILTALEQPFELSGQELRVTASIGICTYPEDGADELTLTKHADVAMYQAKAEGENNYQFYSDELDANSLERLTQESSLRQALGRREFVLLYQARRDTADGRITGMEALLHWQHPTLGMLAPLQFMQIAEDTGLIVPIGKWALQAACLQTVAWQDQGLPDMQMAVKLTSRQFLDENLLHDVQAILGETAMQAPLLELEISENVLFHDIDKTLRIMSGLKDMGVKIAVDDFGTSYSSLFMLRRFPLDTIKMRRSFTLDLMVSTSREAIPNKQAFTEAIFALGRSLSMTTVAEGVQTKEQADYLRVHGCDAVQSFYFDDPLRADRVTQLLREQAAPSIAAAG